MKASAGLNTTEFCESAAGTETNATAFKFECRINPTANPEAAALLYDSLTLTRFPPWALAPLKVHHPHSPPQACAMPLLLAENEVYGNHSARTHCQ